MNSFKCFTCTPSINCFHHSISSTKSQAQVTEKQTISFNDKGSFNTILHSFFFIVSEKRIESSKAAFRKKNKKDTSYFLDT